MRETHLFEDDLSPLGLTNSPLPKTHVAVLLVDPGQIRDLPQSLLSLHTPINIELGKRILVSPVQADYDFLPATYTKRGNVEQICSHFTSDEDSLSYKRKFPLVLCQRCCYPASP